MSPSCLDSDPAARLAQARAYVLQRLTGAARTDFENHLAGCAVCAERVLAMDSGATRLESDLASVPAESGSGIGRIIPMPASRWKLVAAVAAAAVTVLVLCLVPSAWHRTPAPGDDALDWRDLAVEKAAYLPPLAGTDDLVWRGDQGESAPGAPGAGRNSDLARAMQPYEAGDYGTAVRSLEEFLAAHPGDGAALFYEGVSLLLLGRAEDSLAPLEQASMRTAGSDRDEALWYLALARLKTGNPEAAIEDLDRVVAGGGMHAQEAAALRGRASNTAAQ